MNVPHCDIALENAPEVAIYEMEHSGYKARIMSACKLPDNGKIHPLPTGRTIPIIPIHCLPGCPDDWVRESGSYIVPVRENIALWFDWTQNDDYNVAIVPSVKGMNPLTGQKMEGCQMEQYRDECPVHKIPFAHDRYCEKCDYKWIPQNYVSHPNILWVDGFAQPDGTVRQFFYTADIERDVATALIGKKNTVPAFGFAFFKYKRERPVEHCRSRGISHYGGQLLKSYDGNSNSEWNSMLFSYSNSTSSNSHSTTNTATSYKLGKEVRCKGIVINDVCKSISLSDCGWQNRVSDYDYSAVSVASSAPGAAMEDAIQNTPVNYCADDIKMLSEDEGRKLRPELYEKMEKVKEVSVGAGAAINQKLEVDTRPLADYHAEPQALMRIYFVFEPQLKEIISKGGIKKIEGKKKGFLQAVKVGA